MKFPQAFAFLVLALLIGGVSRSAAQESAPPAELKTAMDQHAAAINVLAGRQEEQLAAARAWYVAALDKLQSEATSRGELDAALAVKAERERASANKLTAEDAKTVAPGTLAYRQRYDQAVVQVAAQAKAQEAAVLRTYIATLDDLQKRITMRGDLTGALKVKDERTSAANRLAGTPPIPVPEPPKTTAAPPPPPVAPSSTLPMAAQPIAVAGSLVAKGAATEVAPGAIVFDAPRGDGRGGAKGLLWKSDPASLRGGSTWAFRYTRGGSAQTLQIIHPSGRGQAIVHLGTGSIGLSTPKAWQEVGYGAGEKQRVKETKAFDEIFPLKDGQEYAVVSRLSTGGAFELFINDKLVATGHVAGADPLSLKIPEGKSAPNTGRGPQEFKGADLPPVWSAGWGGLIVGPIDSGENRCTEIRFYPGLADLGPGKR
jgi:hypothetical protein